MKLKRRTMKKNQKLAKKPAQRQKESKSSLNNERKEENGIKGKEKIKGK